MSAVNLSIESDRVTDGPEPLVKLFTRELAKPGSRLFASDSNENSQAESMPLWLRSVPFGTEPYTNAALMSLASTRPLVSSLARVR